MAIRLLCSSLLLVLCSPGFAVEVAGLYQATVAVETRGDTGEQQRAFTEGMQQVLLKISGQEMVLENPAIRNALNNAQNYVESWSYDTREQPAADPGQPAQSILEMQIDFFRPELDELLSDTNIAVWPTNRQATLVWMVEESELGVRRVLGQDDDGELINSLQREAQKRGIPLLLPLLDLDDRRFVDTEQLWNLDDEHIQSISRRYSAESVLVIRVFSSLGDEFLGRSKYYFRGQQLSLDIYGDSLDELVTAPVNLAADELAAYYAVRLGRQGAGVTAYMSVEGVEDLRDYADLLNYIDSLTDVSDYMVSSISEDKVELKLSTGGQIRQLVESIALGRSLREQGSVTRGEGGAMHMSYRWED